MSHTIIGDRIEALAAKVLLQEGASTIKVTMNGFIIIDDMGNIYYPTETADKTIAFWIQTNFLWQVGGTSNTYHWHSKEAKFKRQRAQLKGMLLR